MFNREMNLLARTQRIRMIADDCVSYFALKFPSAHWSVWLDRAVDRIVENAHVNQDVADRVARASLYRAKKKSVQGQQTN
jgi:hypothetical protein